MPLDPETRLGPYEIVRAIGAGGMGEVYRARDPRLGRDVAVKALPELFASDPERTARFKREAQILASLNDPHIAAIYGLEEVEGARFLILELVEGDTLAERVASGPLSVQDALRIAQQVAGALEAAHERGIIHRDLKPANVKVTPAGVVKVLDFGLAKAVAGTQASGDLSLPATRTTDATNAETIVGTVAYMSPEQTRGGALDKRSDIWAFGCLLYEMLTARRPFAGRTTFETVAAILGQDPDWSLLPPTAPARIDWLIPPMSRERSETPSARHRRCTHRNRRRAGAGFRSGCSARIGGWRRRARAPTVAGTGRVDNRRGRRRGSCRSDSDRQPDAATAHGRGTDDPRVDIASRGRAPGRRQSGRTLRGIAGWPSHCHRGRGSHRQRVAVGAAARCRCRAAPGGHRECLLPVLVP